VILLSKDVQVLWQDIIQANREDSPGGAWEIWMRTCEPLEVVDGTLVLDVPNVFVKEQIQSRFLESLCDSARKQGNLKGVELRVSAEVRPAEQQRAEKAATPAPPVSRFGLNPNYVFDSFVIGKSNRLAHAASLAVAESPGVAYNPLFVWGGVGLGKTHLMHAIGHYLLNKQNNAKVCYVSSEKFTNELISSIKDNRTQEFKNRYRSVDVLLIDDIQFLANKESTQEEFFHTFNSLHDAKRQIVISSDRPPKEIQRVEERLVSRFEWGLVTDIQIPDLETRIAILQKKAILRGWTIPEEVINFLATNIPRNIRELEGSLNRIAACAELNNEPMTVENAAVWLKDIIRHVSKGPVTIDVIQQYVAEGYGMSVEDLTSSKRTAEVSLARQVAMYISRSKTEASLQQIGYAFKKKDHTTVIHACKKITEMLKSDPKIRIFVDNITDKL
jgi:chromosomal replication initiator protein